MGGNVRSLGWGTRATGIVGSPYRYLCACRQFAVYMADGMPTVHWIGGHVQLHHYHSIRFAVAQLVVMTMTPVSQRVGWLGLRHHCRRRGIRRMVKPPSTGSAGSPVPGCEENPGEAVVY